MKSKLILLKKKSKSQNKCDISRLTLKLKVETIDFGPCAN